ncbi:hypothetical protein BHE74_00018991, partial [Ensete ventricosum]
RPLTGGGGGGPETRGEDPVKGVHSNNALLSARARGKRGWGGSWSAPVEVSRRRFTEGRASDPASDMGGFPNFEVNEACDGDGQTTTAVIRPSEVEKGELLLVNHGKRRAVSRYGDGCMGVVACVLLLFT